MTAYTLKLGKLEGIYSIWKFIKLLIIKIYNFIKLFKYSYIWKFDASDIIANKINSVDLLFGLLLFPFKEGHWLKSEANQRISKLGEYDGSWKVASIKVFMICKLLLLVGYSYQTDSIQNTAFHINLLILFHQIFLFILNVQDILIFQVNNIFKYT